MPGARSELAPRRSEQILIDALADVPSGRILCTSLGRGQFAAAAARALPGASIHCCFLDLYLVEQAAACAPEAPANLRFVCEADFAPDEIDVFALPISAGGEAELARDFLQSGHSRLKIGGQLLAATDNPDDSWLHGEMRNLFRKVTRRSLEDGVLYLAKKTEPLRRIRNFECRFAFRDEGRLIQAVSRPGVFGHRRVDGGARALLRTAVVCAGNRILELGCGSGIVSLAAALRAEGTQVDAIDSNLRAVACTRLGAALNGLSNVEVHAGTVESTSRQAIPDGSFDLVLANPPYYSNYRIAEIFARRAAQAVKPAGTALFVTKKADWYEERLPEFFARLQIETVGEYQVVRARHA